MVSRARYRSVIVQVWGTGPAIAQIKISWRLDVDRADLLRVRSLVFTRHDHGVAEKRIREEKSAAETCC